MKLYPSLVVKLGVVPAIVLSQIFYWNQGRLRVKRKGALWLAKSRAEMCKETGLSLYQEKRAIAFLKRYGWIIVERGLFGNRITPHILLTKKGKLLFEETVSQKPTDQSEATGTDQLVLEDANPLVQNGTNPITVTTAVNTAETTAVGGYAAKPMHSKDIKELLQEKKQVKDDDVGVKKISGVLLKRMWEKLLPVHHPNLPVLKGGLKVNLTQKEVGMLSQFLKVTGPDKAYGIMKWAVSNWFEFAVDVREAKGDHVSSIPRVGYLLKHYDIAAAGYAKSLKPVGGNVALKPLSEGEQKAKIQSWGKK